MRIRKNLDVCSAPPFHFRGKETKALGREVNPSRNMHTSFCHVCTFNPVRIVIRVKALLSGLVDTCIVNYLER